MQDTWNDIALPILRAVQEMEAEESGAGKAWWGVYIGKIAERMGKSINEIGPQLDSLEYDGYVSVKSNTPTSGHPHRHMGVRLLPEGRKALGEWPADPMTALAVALARALEDASAESDNPDEQSRLRSLAKQLREAGPSIAVTLLLKGHQSPLRLRGVRRPPPARAPVTPSRGMTVTQPTDGQLTNFRTSARRQANRSQPPAASPPHQHQHRRPRRNRQLPTTRRR